MMDISRWQSSINDSVPIGKRIKRVVFSPDDGKLFYFKEPKEKYPWEFWTEVISYEIGKRLGFNVLEYRPAIFKEKAGCISPSMIDNNEELIHGQQFLTQLFKSFETKRGDDHTFQLVEHFFLNNHNLSNNFQHFIDMMIFDAVIGNRDRHQQNWAVIRSVNIDVKKFTLNAKVFNQNITIPKIIWKLIISSFSSKNQNRLGDISVEIIENFKFSPFFDNGNSLAYNILEDGLFKYLYNKNQMDKYLFGSNAVSHIKWNGESLPHIDILKKVNINHKESVFNTINVVANKAKDLNIEDIINNIDKDFDMSRTDYLLSLQRKELICLLLTRRIERLLNSF